MKHLKKPISLALLFFSLTMLSNCHGKFALVRKTYELIDSTGSKGRLGKTIRSTLFFVVTFSIGSFIGIIDYLFLNVYEFWTDKNPIAYNEYDNKGIFVKNLQQGKQNLCLTYSEYGKTLQLEFSEGKKKQVFWLFRENPGQLFQKQNGKLQAISIKAQKIGSKVVLQLARDGKLQSSKVVDYQGYRELAYAYNSKVF
ncbi:MAG: DUF3332 family protein [Bacteroidota bacterium]